MMEKGLKHTCNLETTVLILGTLPSVLSRHKQRYYGNPNNHFWKIISAVFNQDIYTSDDLSKRGVGLWDVVAECEIESSKDNTIKNPEFNDFSIIQKQCPNLKKIFCNGSKAWKLFEDYLNQLEDNNLKDWLKIRLEKNYLPSSSPARAMKIEDKCAVWKKITDY